MSTLITREYVNAKLVLVAHQHGGRPLTREYPVNRLRWAVHFAEIDLDLVANLDKRTEQALLDHAIELGRPLKKPEVRTILLAQVLVGN